MTRWSVLISETLLPIFLNSPFSNHPKTQSHLSFHGLVLCRTISERSIHLNTRNCLETRKNTLTTFWYFICDMVPCITISKTIHLITSYCLETRKCGFGPKSWLVNARAITPKHNPSLLFVIWNLMVQFQKEPYTYTSYCPETTKMLVLSPYWSVISKLLVP